MSKSNSSRSPLPHGSHFPQKLRQRLGEDLLLTGKSKRTHNAYLRAVRQLSDFAQCSPEDVTETQVRQFFLHLKYLGHSSLQTTMVYLHLTETAEANAREVIEDLFGKVPGQNDDDDNAAGSLAKLK